MNFQPVSRRCGGKINLYLKVTGKRDDGYHLLQTLFQPVTLPADEVTIRPAETFCFRVPGHPELSGRENLCCRAAELYTGMAGIAAELEIELQKNIPVAAGLGGGSADAAGVLEALNDLFHRFSAAELAELAVKLGADVPFFLHRKPAWAAGIGEIFTFTEPAGPLPELLILFPNFPVSAQWAYTHLAPENIGPAPADIAGRFAAAFADGSAAAFAPLLHNDLAPALYRKFPLLTLWRRELLDCGAAAAEISGSGPSLFALFDGEAAAAARQLREKFRDYAGLRLFTSEGEF